MKYLITGWWVELEAHLPQERFEQVLDREILPAIEMLSQWEEDGRIYGGVLRGEKAGAWVIEAEWSEEVGRLLGRLPSWGQ